ncbi:MAG: indolepyruvate ferredoxin oxidoreductase subunit alpha, partial [Candidatus Omnitrophica bacterium]|nr:indolepyruvate ferredoxin oxidoreductase subunit alpha [Candidatus Omnitrophota bacterium]
MKFLLSGNEAIARGAFEAGVSFASGYPGTPSTEILENIAEFDDIDAQWSPNEKVALDVAVGASLGGRRSLVAMKHVGLNVASDTLMTLSYTGVNGGLVIVSADDPGMHSSQNEQDNRNYAKFAKIPLLEPSDSQEAKDYVIRAFEISERFDTPVLVRITTRIAHSKSPVLTRRAVSKRRFSGSFKSMPSKYVMVPSNAQKRRIFVEERLAKLKKLSEKIGFNRIERGRSNLGIISSGISYVYAKEAAAEASILKLGMTYPLPELLIKSFAAKYRPLYVIEELDPFLEEQIKAMGVSVKGKELFPSAYELNQDIIKGGFAGRGSPRIKGTESTKKSPSPCTGCFYLGIFYIFRKLNLKVMGDIGCYAL